MAQADRVHSTPLFDRLSCLSADASPVRQIGSDNRTSQTQCGTAEMTALPALVVPNSLPATIAAELEAAVDLARAEKSEATRRAYRTDFRLFSAWCESKGVLALPA